MRKTSVLLCCILLCMYGFSQKWSAPGHGFMSGTLIKGKWSYTSIQKVKNLIDFTNERIIIKDSSGTLRYHLLKDVVTKRVDEDSCITSLRTGFDKDNIRCMVNIVEFNNGMNVLNILYANFSYTYYFRHHKE